MLGVCSSIVGAGAALVAPTGALEIEALLSADVASRCATSSEESIVPSKLRARWPPSIMLPRFENERAVRKSSSRRLSVGMGVFRGEKEVSASSRSVLGDGDLLSNLLDRSQKREDGDVFGVVGVKGVDDCGAGGWDCCCCPSR